MREGRLNVRCLDLFQQPLKACPFRRRPARPGPLPRSVRATLQLTAGTATASVSPSCANRCSISADHRLGFLQCPGAEFAVALHAMRFRIVHQAEAAFHVGLDQLHHYLIGNLASHRVGQSRLRFQVGMASGVSTQRAQASAVATSSLSLRNASPFKYVPGTITQTPPPRLAAGVRLQGTSASTPTVSSLKGFSP